MFGPNAVPSIHHREIKFKELYQNLIAEFKNKFDLHDYIIIPITGSGTLSLQIVLHSLKCKVKPIFINEEFGDRLKKIIDVENNVKDTLCNAIAYPAYETSISSYNDAPKEKGTIKFIDAVSSFPYYKIPKDTDIFVTVNSKQLGAPPGLSFIGLKKTVIPFLKEEEFSYLSLKRYLRYNDDYQTPNTPCISIMQDTYKILKKFHLDLYRKMINTRRKSILELVSSTDVIGTGPVLTLKKMDTKVQDEMNIYHRKYSQIFLWTGSDDEYKILYKKLKGNK